MNVSSVPPAAVTASSAATAVGAVSAMLTDNVPIAPAGTNRAVVLPIWLGSTVTTWAPLSAKSQSPPGAANE